MTVAMTKELVRRDHPRAPDCCSSWGNHWSPVGLSTNRWRDQYVHRWQEFFFKKMSLLTSFLITFRNCLSNHLKAIRDLPNNKFEKPPGESVFINWTTNYNLKNLKWMAKIERFWTKKVVTELRVQTNLEYWNLL